MREEEKMAFKIVTPSPLRRPTNIPRPLPSCQYNQQLKTIGWFLPSS